MTYLKYSNLCADMVRAALKEPAKSKAKAREVIYYRSALWKNGVPEKQGGLLISPQLKLCNDLHHIGTNNMIVSSKTRSFKTSHCSHHHHSSQCSHHGYHRRDVWQIVIKQKNRV